MSTDFVFVQVGPSFILSLLKVNMKTMMSFTWHVWRNGPQVLLTDTLWLKFAS